MAVRNAALDPSRTEVPIGQKWSDLYPSEARQPIQHAAPTRSPLSVTDDVVRDYLAGLVDLGLSDPTGCAEPHERALALRVEALVPAPNNLGLRRRIASGVATGQTDTITADTELGTLVDSEDLDRIKERKRMLRAAASGAWVDAARLLYTAGDALITDLLRPVVDDALANRTHAEAERRWTKAHEIAARLRQFGVVPSCNARIEEHQFGDPLELHYWRLEHCTQIKTTSGFVDATGIYWLRRHAVDAPPITWARIAEHASEWRPGLYTAAEVLTNLAAIDGPDDRGRRPDHLQPQPAPPDTTRHGGDALGPDGDTGDAAALRHQLRK